MWLLTRKTISTFSLAAILVITIVSLNFADVIQQSNGPKQRKLLSKHGDDGGDMPMEDR